MASLGVAWQQFSVVVPVMTTVVIPLLRKMMSRSVPKNPL